MLLQPQVGKQQIAAEMQVDVMIYGGAAGCVDGKTEFLSETGWKYISEYKEGDKVMQIDPDTQDGSFVTPLKYIKEKSNGFYKIKSPRGLNQMLSAEHKVLGYHSKTKEPYVKSMYELKVDHDSKVCGANFEFHTTYNYSGNALNISEDLLRFYVSLKADGSLVNERTGLWRVRLKKQRKIIRFRRFLEKVGQEHKEQFEESTGFSNFGFHLEPFVCSKFFSDWMLCAKDDANIIADELKYWDGYYLVKGNRQPSITTVIKKDADAIQYFFTVSGLRSSLRSDGRKGQTYRTYGKDYIRNSDTYQVVPTTQTKLNLSRKAKGKLVIDLVKGGEYKYCFEVPTGFLVIRRGGDIVLTGNSGKSRLLLNKAAYFAHNDPNFEGVMFRRNIGPLRAAGGLFSEAKKLYRPLGVDLREQAMEISFHGEGGSKKTSTGGNLKFTHLEHENDAEGNHQGLQYSFVGFKFRAFM